MSNARNRGGPRPPAVTSTDSVIFNVFETKLTYHQTASELCIRCDATFSAPGMTREESVGWEPISGGELTRRLSSARIGQFLMPDSGGLPGRPTVGESFRQALTVSQRAQRGLRIIVDFPRFDRPDAAPVDLATLEWERAHALPANGTLPAALGRYRGISIVRRGREVLPDWNPVSGRGLRLVTLIGEGIDHTESTDLSVFGSAYDLRGDSVDSIKELGKRLQKADRPTDILRIVAHLEKGGSIRDVNAPIDQGMLAGLVVGTAVRLVIFSSCYSAAEAPSQSTSSTYVKKMLNQGVPIVIGMQRTIHQEVDRQFVDELLKSLAIGRTFDQSVTDARIFLYSAFEDSYPGSWSIPTVHLNTDANSLVLWQETPEAPVGEPAPAPIRPRRWAEARDRCGDRRRVVTTGVGPRLMNLAEPELESLGRAHHRSGQLQLSDDGYLAVQKVGGRLHLGWLHGTKLTPWDEPVDVSEYEPAELLAVGVVGSDRDIAVCLLGTVDEVIAVRIRRTGDWTQTDSWSGGSPAMALMHRHRVLPAYLGTDDPEVGAVCDALPELSDIRSMDAAYSGGCLVVATLARRDGEPYVDVRVNGLRLPPVTCIGAVTVTIVRELDRRQPPRSILIETGGGSLHEEQIELPDDPPPSADGLTGWR